MGKPRNVPGFQYPPISEERADGYGGVAIYIKVGFKYTELPFRKLSGIQGVGIELWGRNRNLKIYNVYIPHPGRVAESDIVQIGVRGDIIVGDFNLHHPLWAPPGSMRNYFHNKKLTDALIKHLDCQDFMVANKGQITHKNHVGKEDTAIDLTILPIELAGKAENCSLKNSMGSDHLPQLTQLWITPIFEHAKCHNMWRTDKADWKGYNEAANSIFTYLGGEHGS